MPANPSSHCETLSGLLRDIRACRLCAAALPHGVRPVLRAGETAKICIYAQAPGMRAHQSGLNFDDPSGDRLRDWMGIDRAAFYDESRIAIIGMGFCFPGYHEKGGDLPPRKICAETWQDRLQAVLPDFRLTLIVGSYAQARHMQQVCKTSLTETVRAWRMTAPAIIPLPHPSWRNNAWIAKHPWFGEELLPELKRLVRQALA